MPPTGMPASVTPSGTSTGGAASPLRTGARPATTTIETRRRRNTAVASYLRARASPKVPSGAPCVLERKGGAHRRSVAPPEKRFYGFRPREGRVFAAEPGRKARYFPDPRRRTEMAANELHETAKALVAEGKGILAADESNRTIKKRL